MDKKVTKAFGKKIYLLGKDRDGRNAWLEEGSWDCDWYWGFGYIETYTNNNSPSKARDIESHRHFKFLEEPNLFEGFKREFKETPLSDGEIWKLCELMKSFYIAEEYSEMLHRGGAHYTTNPCSDIIKSDAEYKRINEEVIPGIMKEIYKIWEV